MRRKVTRVAERILTDTKEKARKAVLKVARVNSSRAKNSKVVAALTAQQASQKNLESIVNVLDKENIDYFIVRGLDRTRHCLAILDRDRQKFISQVLAHLGGNESHTWVGLNTVMNKSQRVTPVCILKNHFLAKKTMANKTSFRLWTNFVSEKDDFIAGPELGCDVEIWRRGETYKEGHSETTQLLALLGLNSRSPLDGALIAPRQNQVTRWLHKSELKPVTVKIGDKKYRTFKPFTETLIGDVDFPIDVVYTWVDGSDPKWYKEFLKHKNELEPNKGSNSSSRYVNRNELLYSLRSLHMYAPFIRNIYIVTAGQKPEWLNENAPGITIIDHKDIFKDKSALPVYNSHAIGTQLHHIPGLSNHYLYFNDDVLVGRPITPEMFFTPSGLAKIVMSPSQFGGGKPLDLESAPGFAGKNVRKLLMESFGRYITNKMKHVPQPQLKQVAIELENKYTKQVNQTAHSKFRATHDISFAGTLHHSYALITGRAIEANYRSKVINISRPDAGRQMDYLLEERNADVLCLNETAIDEDMLETVNKRVYNFFESYYPVPSPWEKK
jgi:hypothetical protein